MPSDIFTLCTSVNLSQTGSAGGDDEVSNSRTCILAKEVASISPPEVLFQEDRAFSYYIAFVNAVCALLV